MNKEDCTARRLDINGIVQGVGFRPFIYRFARQFGLRGYVANTASGVRLHVEGCSESVNAFCHDLTCGLPPHAVITDISILEVPAGGYPDFSISKSVDDSIKSTLISPDLAVCDDCLHEMDDPSDRRWCYPFINCTNCGPRYSIISSVPYDRPSTSMKHFKMCERCEAEYRNPADRRFHAQPNACPQCGPRVELYDRSGRKVDTDDPVGAAAERLKAGGIVAVKGLGGYHLAVDAEHDAAVKELRKRKLREEKPFALMAHDLDQIRAVAWIDPLEEAALMSPQRPIVILRQKQPNRISPAVAPGNSCFGVMLAYTPLHYLLLSRVGAVLVMTSGNSSREPICIDNREAFSRLSSIADWFLVHNRDIYQREDDSIVRVVSGRLRQIRRSRGYVPAPVTVRKKLPKILGCGADLKNTVCLTRENHAVLSQHIGDLDQPAVYDVFRQTVDHLIHVLGVKPDIVAYDLHPDYRSTCYALAQKGMTPVGVQHHHAHVAGCMAEHQLDGPVIGLAFDGTGYGTDGTIWGGEILIAEYARFRRVAHLDPIPMPGGEAAIRQPWRMALSCLHAVYGNGLGDLNLPVISAMDETRLRVIAEMISKRINSPLTSSLGRFFDAVAALAGIRYDVSFEGQAAMELEMVSDQSVTACYEFGWEKADTFRIVLEPIISGVVADVSKGVSRPVISAKFHQTLIQLFSRICVEIKKDTGLDQVVLSGGVFQNSILMAGLIRELEQLRFKVYTHHLIPCNDGGISFGQAMVAAAGV